MPKGIKSLRGFVQRIESLQQDTQGTLFYRGHTKRSFRQMPSVFREDGYRKNERQMLYSLMSESPREFDNDRYTFDKLVRAQHYGIPTRLLDVTTNPLMALYFACEKDFSSRGQVIIYEVPADLIKYSMSDTVSCASNLVHLNEQEKFDILAAIRESIKENFPGTRTQRLRTLRSQDEEKYYQMVEDVNEYKIFDRLVQFIREEKPYFRNEIDPLDLVRAHVTIPKKNNPRVLAQSGAFLLFGLQLELVRTNMPDVKTQVIDIAPSDKKPMLKSLNSVGIYENSVYPELDRAANKIKNFYISED